jgi:CBS domain-containing protein
VSDHVPFHEVGSLFPEEYSIVSVEPATPVAAALAIMLEKRYSQLPVVDGGTLRGVFSLWSLAHQIADAPQLKIADLKVADVMEDLPAVTVSDSLHSILQLLNHHDALLVNSPHGLQAVATPIDVLKYFYSVAQPFILVQEIELALRDLITHCAGTGLPECIEHALGSTYQRTNRPLPTDLYEMTFDDYRALITTKSNWPLFEPIFGSNRELVVAKLSRARDIRNEVLHFRPHISVLDYETLTRTRQWLLDKEKQARKAPKEKTNAT